MSIQPNFQNLYTLNRTHHKRRNNNKCAHRRTSTKRSHLKKNGKLHTVAAKTTAKHRRNKNSTAKKIRHHLTKSLRRRYPRKGGDGDGDDPYGDDKENNIPIGPSNDENAMPTNLQLQSQTVAPAAAVHIRFYDNAQYNIDHFDETFHDGVVQQPNTYQGIFVEEIVQPIYHQFLTHIDPSSALFGLSSSEITKKASLAPYDISTEYIKHIIYEGKKMVRHKNRYVEFLRSTGKHERVFPVKGFEEYDELVSWAANIKSNDVKLILFDWDMTISCVEGLSIPTKDDALKYMMSIEEMLVYLLGGQTRLSLLRNMFRRLSEIPNTEIYIVTLNGYAKYSNTRPNFTKIIRELIPGFNINHLIYGGFSVEFDDTVAGQDGRPVTVTKKREMYQKGYKFCYDLQERSIELHPSVRQVIDTCVENIPID